MARWFSKIKSTDNTQRTFFLALLFWILVLVTSFGVHWVEEKDALIEIATIEAHSNFNKDLVYRRWATMHGGVYVPPTETTPPNPYLAQLPDRDVVTTDGKRLTLVNPAYMTRQVHELAEDQYGIRGHITSLNPLRPENSPDDWERKALRAFEDGSREFSSVESIDGEPFLRFMRPMITAQGCLKCHENQGYESGEIRGGISFAIPLAPYLETAAEHQNWQTAAHGFIGILGMLGIWIGSRNVSRSQAALREERNQLTVALSGADLGTWNFDMVTGQIT
ncbi:MAG TPA: DUF3365 domain-containing protein, partial [Desulfuromonadales bacterium]|nr:DUF3365 domain-containing protein [Desulfuromonadales bacterium]